MGRLWFTIAVKTELSAVGKQLATQQNEEIEYGSTSHTNERTSPSQEDEGKH